MLVLVVVLKVLILVVIFSFCFYLKFTYVQWVGASMQDVRLLSLYWAVVWVCSLSCYSWRIPSVLFGAYRDRSVHPAVNLIIQRFVQFDFKNFVKNIYVIVRYFVFFLCWFEVKKRKFGIFFSKYYKYFFFYKIILFFSMS